MRVEVAFGREGLELELPVGPRYEVLRAQAAGALGANGSAEVRAAIEAALDRPVAGPGLETLARGRRTAAISVCDITRPAPNALTLPPLLERLHRAGMRAEDVTLCIATGLHRPATEAELRVILGAEVFGQCWFGAEPVAGRYRVVNHEAKDRAAHRAVGETRSGTPVLVEEAFCAAELHLTLGFIEQHLMLGFSGGRKLIAPGLAAQETIKVIHSPRWMREQRATEGSYEDNPLHAELLEIAGMVRHDFLLDVTLTREREISGVFAGEPVAAHAAGVRFLRASSLVELAEPVDAVITTAAGWPLDLTFYQTIKGVTAVEHILRPGGRILVVSACAEGAGSPEFCRKLASYGGDQAFLDDLRQTPVEVDQWQLEKLALVGLKHEVLFHIPGLRAGEMGALGARHFERAGDALAALVRGLPAGARVAVVPEGPYVFARVAEPSVVRG